MEEKTSSGYTIHDIMKAKPVFDTHQNIERFKIKALEQASNLNCRKNWLKSLSKQRIQGMKAQTSFLKNTLDDLLLTKCNQVGISPSCLESF